MGLVKIVLDKVRKEVAVSRTFVRLSKTTSGSEYDFD